MQTISRTFACAALIALTACGGKQSMASKSAAAFQEAQKKGIPVSAGEHGGHAGEETTTMPSEHDGMDHAAVGHAAMNHVAMDHGAMNHVAMDHGTMDHAAMDHGSMQHEQMTGMQHGAMPGMSHGATANVDVNIEAPRSNSAIANIQPAATLRSDEFDAPATTTGDAPHGKEHHP
jgi:uncharacterized protein involved in copper resistance